MAFARAVRNVKSVLFVCTGNICRSPIAEGLFGRLLGNRKDTEVTSAGVHAVCGQPPSLYAVQVCEEEGVDISGLRSQPLTAALVDRATHIFAMTGAHLETIEMLFPQGAEKSFLLREFEQPGTTVWRDLPDPIGLGREVYEDCARIVKNALPSVLTFVEQGELVRPGTARGPDISYSVSNHAPQIKTGMIRSTSSPRYGDALRRVDPEIFDMITAEEKRQRENIELIASENFTSRAVMEAQGSVLTNKYAEGYPSKRWYGGCENVDTVEQLAIDRAKELFGAEHVNVQPHAGAQANAAVYHALMEPGERFLGMALDHGGHLTHGRKINVSGRLYHPIPYHVRHDDSIVDMDEVERLAREHRPKMILAGWSAYPRILDFERFRAIADEIGAILFVDMAHFAGLVAAGLHPNPVPFADVVSTTTHKTLGGARGGMILCRSEHAKAIDSAVFPGQQGGPLEHVIAGKAVALRIAQTEAFRERQERTVEGARAVAEELVGAGGGIDVLTGGTDVHLVLVDLR